MAGAAKNRVAAEQHSSRSRPSASSSGEASSASKPSQSARSTPSRAGTSRSNDPRPSRYDGNNEGAMPEATASRAVIDPRNFDLGMSGWAVVRGTNVASTMPPRPALTKMGQAVKIGLNTYHVEHFPRTKVYQFDVTIGSGVEKRGVIQKVWNSKPVQQALGGHAIFDGNKLAWSGKPIDREIRLVIDLDAEQGKTPRPGKGPDQHRIVVRQAKIIQFEKLSAYLQGKTDFDSHCLEAINFADHLLRQTPSQKYTAIKRAFFQKGETRFALGGGVEAFKGVYQSLRCVHPGRLSVNLDVANGTFWVAQPFVKAAVAVCNVRNEPDLVAAVEKGGEKSRAGKELKRMRRLHVVANHRGGNKDEYVVDRFLYTNAKSYKVQVTDPNGKEVEMTLYDFFAQKYKIRVNWPGMPLVKMTRGKNTVLPMEVLTLKENQRYSFKMDERQTANMIKFAVTAPPERYQGIQHGLKMLDWASDPMLQKYGMQINPNKTVVEGRLLPAPTVKFGVGEAKPGVSGRWDLKGKKFLQGNSAPLKSWGVCVISGRRGGKPDKSVIENFIVKFIQGYQNHGGKVENKQPNMSLATGDDVSKAVTDAWNGAGNQANARPQMLMFILPDKDSVVYGRIKRSCECRYGVVSQCVQYTHVQKCQPQYISNVCMKFNAKLGGITCKAVGTKTANGHFTVPTMVIGADVSHAAPGSQAASMAAMTISMDRLCTRYAAVRQTNGFRQEMIMTDTINKELKPVIKTWMENVGGGKLPQVIVYMRDGVSEGQFTHVLQQEIKDMKQLLKGADPSNNTKFIVVVGSKRHHIRFFPEKGDRNGNANPGTVVETGVTNPHENDFYLQSHAAIKGTARPAHYYVLLNETNMSNDQLMTMLYEQAYQYIRASTPISQHPAIYYAHLVSNRAIPHDRNWTGASSDGGPPPTSLGVQRSGSQSGSQVGGSGTGSSSGAPSEFPPLLDMPNVAGHNSIKTAMWYI